MKNLWIGLNANEELNEKFLKNGAESLSANVSQNNLVEGIKKNGGVLDSINAPHIPVFPAYKEIKVKEYRWSENEMKNISVGFWNIKYISVISKKNKMSKAAKRWALKCKDKDPVVFVYQMHSPFMIAAYKIKKILPDTKIVLIVPDLPQYMDMNMSKLKQILKYIDWICIKWYMRKINYYVLYSEHMARFLGISSKKWMVMEGSINKKEFLKEEVNKKTKAIMYSGVCDEKYGIPLLLDAFARISDQECELWFTGNGNAVELIIERAKNDKRIKYLGYLPSRKELLLKQKEAMAMINMRMPDEESSQYCFPSKIFEYMLSGNPVLSFMIEGIPKKYFEYLVIIEDVSVSAIVKSIQEVLNMSGNERRERGDRAQKFVLDEKNNIIQTQKILKFIESNN